MDRPSDPSAIRKVYFEAWQKHLSHSVLTPMETIIVDLIQQHPEYHALFATLENYEAYADEKFDIEHNPFFHLGLHIAIKEQVMTDKPVGIRTIYQKLRARLGSEMETEHRMIPCLIDLLTSIRDPHNLSADEEKYLSALKYI